MFRACLVGCMGLLSLGAWGDGMFMAPMLTERVAGEMGVASTEQKGIIIELPEGREALLIQTTYHGPADRFAWVIPVPGQPGAQDVFLASTDFIDELLGHTKPEVKTTITDPRQKARYKGLGPPAEMMEGAMEPEAAPPSVTVHERLEVGDYDVAVLSATGPEVLVNWLRENGFRVPKDSDELLGHYVEKDWYFVAVRMQPMKAQERPLLEDVAPIGICFDTDELVYPLYISRASSREKTALLLVVLAQKPVECERLREVSLPLGKWSDKGACYAAIRRQELERNPRGAVCEFRALGAMPYSDLHYEKDKWFTPGEGGWSPADLWGTRLWTLVKLEDMEDLSFASTSARGAGRLAIEREGEIHVPLGTRVSDQARQAASSGLLTILGLMLLGTAFFLGAVRLAGRGIRLRPIQIVPLTAATVVFAFVLMIGELSGLIFLALLALVVVPLLALPRREPEETEAQPFVRSEQVRGALIAAGMAVFGYSGYLLMFMRPGQFRYDNPIGRFLNALWDGNVGFVAAFIVLALHIVWILLVVDWVDRGIRRQGRRILWVAIPWVCGMAVCLPGIQDYVEWFSWGPGLPARVVSAATLATLCLLVSFLTFGSFVAERTRRLALPMAYAFVGLVLVVALTSVRSIRPAHAGVFGYIPTTVQELNSALEELDDMLRKFVAANGCYPAKLTDMLGSDIPDEGLDSSGNLVKITRALRDDMSAELQGTLGDGAFAATELPEDPLTGRRDTWVYEPTGSPMVDSGGYRIKITR